MRLMSAGGSLVQTSSSARFHLHFISLVHSNKMPLKNPGKSNMHQFISKALVNCIKIHYITIVYSNSEMIQALQRKLFDLLYIDLLYIVGRQLEIKIYTLENQHNLWNYTITLNKYIITLNFSFYCKFVGL